MFLQVSHPQSQGLTERFKGTLLDMLHFYCNEKHSDWSNPSWIGGLFYRLHCYEPPIRPCHSPEDTGPERLGSDHLAPQGVGRCSSTVAEGAGAAEGILRQQERGATLRGLQISADAGQVGTKKLARHYKGPFEITKRLSDFNYEISLQSGERWTKYKW